MDVSAIQAEVVDHARSTLDHTELALAEFLQKFQERYFGMPRDIDLSLVAKSLLSTVATQRSGKVHIPGKRRIICISGESNAGKSRALIEHIVRAKELQPYAGENGKDINPLLLFEAPSPSYPRLIALEGLKALGITTSAGEGEAWHAFRCALKANRISVLCIEEAQHMIETANVLEKVKIANALKQLVQMPDWPLRLVLVGVNTLDTFVRSQKQLEERTYRISFHPMSVAEGIAAIEDKLPKIIVEQAGLEMAPELTTNEFVRRLLHASSLQFGSVVQMTRDATEVSLREGSSTVTKEDFATAYRLAKGCVAEDNVFIADDWDQIDVGASSRPSIDDNQRSAPAGRREKSVKYGDRP